MKEWQHTPLEKTVRFGRDPYALLIVVLAVLGTTHVLVRTATDGAVIDGDSVCFLSTARNFLAGEGWRDFSGKPLTGWPPLFPLLLVALGWVGIEPLDAGRFINAAAFGLTILAAGLYLRSNLRSRGLTLGTTVAILASLPLTHWASYFRTESLFVLLTLLALMQLAAFLNRKTDAALYWAAVFAALAALTRYPGIVLIGTGVLILLPLAQRRHTLVFGAISSVPLLAVLAHNWVVADTLTGQRTGTEQSLSDSLSQVADTFREWIVPPNTPDGLTYLLWLAVGIVAVSGVLCATRGRSDDRRRNRAVLSYFRLEPALLFGVFAVGYLVVMVAIVPIKVPEPILSRFLLPVYVPLLLAAVFLLDRFLSIKAAGWRVAAKWCLISLVLLAALAHVNYSAHRNLSLTTQARDAGFEEWTYNSRFWESSEILSYIRDNRINGPVYSNNLNLTWFRDRTAAPGKHRRLPSKIQHLTSVIMRGTDGTDGYVLWIRRERRHAVYAYNDFDIRLLPGVEPVVELYDGVLFRVTTTEPFDAQRHRARKQRYVQQLIEQADEQVARAGWTVYHTGRKLIYHKKPCAPADVQAKLVLHIIPTDLNDLPADRKEHGYDSLGFYFNQRGFRLDDQCIAIAQLPDYAIGRIRVGQWIAKEDRTVWEAEFLEIGG